MTRFNALMRYIMERTYQAPQKCGIREGGCNTPPWNSVSWILTQAKCNSQKMMTNENKVAKSTEAI